MGNIIPNFSYLTANTSIGMSCSVSTGSINWAVGSNPTYDGYFSPTTGTSTGYYSPNWWSSCNYIGSLYPSSGQIYNNITTSPRGSGTGRALQDDSSYGQHMVYQSYAAPSGNYYTAVCYLKYGDARYGFIQTTNNYVGIDLIYGSVDFVSPNYPSYSVQSVADGWWKLSVYGYHNGAWNDFDIGQHYSAGVDNTVYAGNGSTTWFWGAQLLLGYFVGYADQHYVTATSTADPTKHAYAYVSVYPYA